MDIEKKITALVALGVDGVRAATIPPAVAQECARRWLVDAARDAERARVREIERAALLALITTPEALARASKLDDDRRGAVGFREWVLSLPGEVLPYFANGVETKRAVDMWREGCDDGEPAKLWRAGRAEEAIERIARNARAFRERNNEARRKAWGRTLLHVDRVIEERAAELEIGWTAALLTTTVALPDGTRVEWGEATREQHAARLDMLAKHAAGEIESASRHRAAIEALDAAGARCLNDLASVTA